MEPESLYLAPNALVTLSNRGFFLPEYRSEASVPLGLEDLTLLVRLEIGASLNELVDAGRTVSETFDEAQAKRLLSALTARGYIKNRPTRRDYLTEANGKQRSAVEPSPVSRIDGKLFILLTPITVVPTTRGFAIRSEATDTVTVLSPSELFFLQQFARGSTLEDAYQRHLTRAANAENTWAFALEAMTNAVEGGVLEPFVPGNPLHEGGHGALERVRRAEMARVRRFLKVSESRQAESMPGDNRSTATGAKVPVLAVHHPIQVPSLALGLILAHAASFDDGRLAKQYDFTPYWNLTRVRMKQILISHGPAVVMFSNYVWSKAANMAMSALVKKLSPDSICIHGGPDTPHYPHERDEFFRRHPDVDVTVRNEGEHTLAEILDALNGDLSDLSVLADVRGVTFRHKGRLIPTPDRPRIAEIDSIPSPYLTGLFEDYAQASAPLMLIETNRGCPYHCTFCDWGSATRSRVRQFSLDRIKSEIEWAGKNRIPRMYVVDANFGIYRRDVEIAECVVKTHHEHGYPIEFHTAYAKNSTKHIGNILSMLIEEGITSGLSLHSLQSVDPATLSAVERTNIDDASFHDLVVSLRQRGIPLSTEMMFGLPGSTKQSFAGDLQFLIDKEITARIFRTEVLANSPMNSPEYRERWGIETAETEGSTLFGVDRNRRVELVTATSTISRDDFEEMFLLRRFFMLAEHHGLLRHLARYTRHEVGVLETEQYLLVMRAVAGEPSRYPLMDWTFSTLAKFSTRPYSWVEFYREVADCFVELFGLSRDTAFETVLAVQLAHVIERHRVFPHNVRLDHDYAAWHSALIDCKDALEDWVSLVPPLRSYPPGEISVRDPTGICTRAIGLQLDNELGDSWELESAVTRVTAPHWATV